MKGRYDKPRHEEKEAEETKGKTVQVKLMNVEGKEEETGKDYRL